VRLGLRTASAPDPVGPAQFDQVRVNRGGQRWTCLARTPGTLAGECDDSLSALLGLVYLPEPDNQTAAIQILVEGSSVDEYCDPGPQAKDIALDLSGDRRQQATLVVRSHARGTLTVANIVQEYA